jgi:MFS family permease
MMLFRNAYSGLSPKIWLLALVMLINRAGTMVVAFLAVYTTQKLHYSIEHAGYVMMMFGVGAIVGAWLGGKLTDLLGHYLVQLLSLGIGGLLFFLVVRLETFEYLCLGVFVLAIFGEAYRPANTVCISHFCKPENFTRSVSLVRLAINLGWAVGPVLGGFFASRDYDYLFYADGITNIMAAGLVWCFLKTKVLKTPKVSKEQKALNKKDSPWRDTYFMVFVGLSTIYVMSFSPIFTVLPVFYKEACNINEQQIGLLMGLNGLLVAAIEMILIYKLENKYSKMQFIFIGCVLLVINYIIYYNFRSFGWLLVGITFGTFSEIFALPFMNTFSLERAKGHNLGQYSAVYSMSWPIAQIISPLLGTQLIAILGYDALIITLGGVAISAAIGFYFMAKD